MKLVLGIVGWVVERRLAVLAGLGASTRSLAYQGARWLAGEIAGGRLEWAVVYGEGAWEEVLSLRETLASEGLNHLVVDGVDAWESGVSRVGLEAIARARASMLASSMARAAPARMDAAKRVSRRALVTRPHRALTLHLEYPLVTRASACKAAVGCNACVESCERGALGGKPPALDPYLCDGCMACLTACRHAALTTPRLTLDSFRALLKALPRSGPKALVLVEWKVLPDVKMRYRGPPAYFLPIEDRRGLHPRLALEAAVAGFALYTISRGREGLNIDPIEADWSYAAQVKVDAGLCTLCGACARACPEGALKLAESGGSVELTFDPALCLACGACARACPEGAVEVTVGAYPGARTVLASSMLQVCPSCGRPFAPARLVERVAAKLAATGLQAALDTVRLCPYCRARAAALRVLGGVLGSGSEKPREPGTQA